MNEQQGAKQIINLMREPWMDDNDFNDFCDELLKSSPGLIEEFTNDLKNGLKNGYSIEDQLSMVKQVLSK